MKWPYNSEPSVKIDLHMAGHRHTGAKMSESYGRIVWSDELLWRNTILATIASGWEMVPSSRIHRNVVPNGRIGRIPSDVPNETGPTDKDALDFHIIDQSVKTIEPNHETNAILPQTQDLTPSQVRRMRERNSNRGANR